MPASKSRTICPGLASPSSTRSAILRGERLRLGRPPALARLPEPRLVGEEQLDAATGRRVARVARLGQERRVALAEVAREHLVHDVDHVRTRAMVPAKRDQLVPRRGPLLAVDRDVGVAEPVDALELVADEEELAAGRRGRSARTEAGSCPGTRRRARRRTARGTSPPGRAGRAGGRARGARGRRSRPGCARPSGRGTPCRAAPAAAPARPGRPRPGRRGRPARDRRGRRGMPRWPRPCADGTRRGRSGRERDRRRAARRGRRPSPTRRAQRRPTSLQRAPRPGRSARPAAGRAGARRCEGARGRRGSSGSGGAGRRWRADRAGGRAPPPGTARARGRTPRAGASPSARRRRSQSGDRGRPRRHGPGGCEGRSDGSSRSTRCRRPGPAPSRRPARAPRAPGA